MPTLNSVFQDIQWDEKSFDYDGFGVLDAVAASSAADTTDHQILDRLREIADVMNTTTLVVGDASWKSERQAGVGFWTRVSSYLDKKVVTPLFSAKSSSFIAQGGAAVSSALHSEGGLNRVLGGFIQQVQGIVTEVNEIIREKEVESLAKIADAAQAISQEFGVLLSCLSSLQTLEGQDQVIRDILEKTHENLGRFYSLQQQIALRGSVLSEDDKKKILEKVNKIDHHKAVLLQVVLRKAEIASHWHLEDYEQYLERIEDIKNSVLEYAEIDSHSATLPDDIKHGIYQLVAACELMRVKQGEKFQKHFLFDQLRRNELLAAIKERGLSALYARTEDSVLSDVFDGFSSSVLYQNEKLKRLVTKHRDLMSRFGSIESMYSGSIVEHTARKMQQLLGQTLDKAQQGDLGGVLDVLSTTHAADALVRELSQYDAQPSLESLLDMRANLQQMDEIDNEVLKELRPYLNENLLRKIIKYTLIIGGILALAGIAGAFIGGALSLLSIKAVLFKVGIYALLGSAGGAVVGFGTSCLLLKKCFLHQNKTANYFLITVTFAAVGVAVGLFLFGWGSYAALFILAGWTAVGLSPIALGLTLFFIKRIRRQSAAQKMQGRIIDNKALRYTKRRDLADQIKESLKTTSISSVSRCRRPEASHQAVEAFLNSNQEQYARISLSLTKVKKDDDIKDMVESVLSSIRKNKAAFSNYSEMIDSQEEVRAILLTAFNKQGTKFSYHCSNGAMSLLCLIADKYSKVKIQSSKNIAQESVMQEDLVQEAQAWLDRNTGSQYQQLIDDLYNSIEKSKPPKSRVQLRSLARLVVNGKKKIVARERLIHAVAEGRFSDVMSSGRSNFPVTKFMRKLINAAVGGYDQETMEVGKKLYAQFAGGDFLSILTTDKLYSQGVIDESNLTVSLARLKHYLSGHSEKRLLLPILKALSGKFDHVFQVVDSGNVAIQYDVLADMIAALNNVLCKDSKGISITNDESTQKKLAGLLLLGYMQSVRSGDFVEEEPQFIPGIAKLFKCINWIKQQPELSSICNVLFRYCADELTWAREQEEPKKITAQREVLKQNPNAEQAGLFVGIYDVVQTVQKKFCLRQQAFNPEDLEQTILEEYQRSDLQLDAIQEEVNSLGVINQQAVVRGDMLCAEEVKKELDRFCRIMTGSAEDGSMVVNQRLTASTIAWRADSYSVNRFSRLLDSILKEVSDPHQSLSEDRRDKIVRLLSEKNLWLMAISCAEDKFVSRQDIWGQLILLAFNLSLIAVNNVQTKTFSQFLSVINGYATAMHHRSHFFDVVKDNHSFILDVRRAYEKLLEQVEKTQFSAARTGDDVIQLDFILSTATAISHALPSENHEILAAAIKLAFERHLIAFDFKQHLNSDEQDSVKFNTKLYTEIGHLSADATASALWEEIQEQIDSSALFQYDSWQMLCAFLWGGLETKTAILQLISERVSPLEAENFIMLALNSCLGPKRQASEQALFEGLLTYLSERSVWSANHIALIMGFQNHSESNQVREIARNIIHRHIFSMDQHFISTGTPEKLDYSQGQIIGRIKSGQRIFVECKNWEPDCTNFKFMDLVRIYFQYQGASIDLKVFPNIPKNGPIALLLRVLINPNELLTVGLSGDKKDADARRSSLWSELLEATFQLIPQGSIRYYANALAAQALVTVEDRLSEFSRFKSLLTKEEDLVVGEQDVFLSLLDSCLKDMMFLLSVNCGGYDARQKSFIVLLQDKLSAIIGKQAAFIYTQKLNVALTHLKEIRLPTQETGEALTELQQSNEGILEKFEMERRTLQQHIQLAITEREDGAQKFDQEYAYPSDISRLDMLVQNSIVDTILRRIIKKYTHVLPQLNDSFWWTVLMRKLQDSAQQHQVTDFQSLALVEFALEIDRTSIDDLASIEVPSILKELLFEDLEQQKLCSLEELKGQLAQYDPLGSCARCSWLIAKYYILKKTENSVLADLAYQSLMRHAVSEIDDQNKRFLKILNYFIGGYEYAIGCDVSQRPENQPSIFWSSFLQGVLTIQDSDQFKNSDGFLWLIQNGTEALAKLQGDEKNQYLLSIERWLDQADSTKPTTSSISISDLRACLRHFSADEHENLHKFLTIISSDINKDSITISSAQLFEFWSLLNQNPDYDVNVLAAFWRFVVLDDESNPDDLKALVAVNAGEQHALDGYSSAIETVLRFADYDFNVEDYVSQVKLAYFTRAIQTGADPRTLGLLGQTVVGQHMTSPQHWGELFNNLYQHFVVVDNLEDDDFRQSLSDLFENSFFQPIQERKNKFLSTLFEQLPMERELNTVKALSSLFSNRDRHTPKMMQETFFRYSKGEGVRLFSKLINILGAQEQFGFDPDRTISSGYLLSVVLGLQVDEQIWTSWEELLVSPSFYKLEKIRQIVTSLSNFAVKLGVHMQETFNDLIDQQLGDWCQTYGFSRSVLLDPDNAPSDEKLREFSVLLWVRQHAIESGQPSIELAIKEGLLLLLAHDEKEFADVQQVLINIFGNEAVSNLSDLEPIYNALSALPTVPEEDLIQSVAQLSSYALGCSSNNDAAINAIKTILFSDNTDLRDKLIAIDGDNFQSVVMQQVLNYLSEPEQKVLLFIGRLLSQDSDRILITDPERKDRGILEMVDREIQCFSTIEDSDCDRVEKMLCSLGFPAVGTLAKVYLAQPGRDLSLSILSKNVQEKIREYLVDSLVGLGYQQDLLPFALEELSNTVRQQSISGSSHQYVETTAKKTIVDLYEDGTDLKAIIEESFTQEAMEKIRYLFAVLASEETADNLFYSTLFGGENCANILLLARGLDLQNRQAVLTHLKNRISALTDGNNQLKGALSAISCMIEDDSLRAPTSSVPEDVNDILQQVTAYGQNIALFTTIAMLEKDQTIDPELYEQLWAADELKEPCLRQALIALVERRKGDHPEILQIRAYLKFDELEEADFKALQRLDESSLLSSLFDGLSLKGIQELSKDYRQVKSALDTKNWVEVFGDIARLDRLAQYLPIDAKAKLFEIIDPSIREMSDTEESEECDSTALIFSDPLNLLGSLLRSSDQTAVNSLQTFSGSPFFKLLQKIDEMHKNPQSAELMTDADMEAYKAFSDDERSFIDEQMERLWNEQLGAPRLGARYYQYSQSAVKERAIDPAEFEGRKALYNAIQYLDSQQQKLSDAPIESRLRDIRKCDLSTGGEKMREFASEFRDLCGLIIPDFSANEQLQILKDWMSHKDHFGQQTSDTVRSYFVTIMSILGMLDAERGLSILNGNHYIRCMKDLTYANRAMIYFFKQEFTAQYEACDFPSGASVSVSLQKAELQRQHYAGTQRADASRSSKNWVDRFEKGLRDRSDREFFSRYQEGEAQWEERLRGRSDSYSEIMSRMQGKTHWLSANELPREATFGCLSEQNNFLYFTTEEVLEAAFYCQDYAFEKPTKSLLKRLARPFTQEGTEIICHQNGFELVDLMGARNIYKVLGTSAQKAAIQSYIEARIADIAESADPVIIDDIAMLSRLSQDLGTEDQQSALQTKMDQKIDLWLESGIPSDFPALIMREDIQSYIELRLDLKLDQLEGQIVRGDRAEIATASAVLSQLYNMTKDLGLNHRTMEKLHVLSAAAETLADAQTIESSSFDIVRSALNNLAPCQPVPEGERLEFQRAMALLEILADVKKMTAPLDLELRMEIGRTLEQLLPACFDKHGYICLLAGWDSDKAAQVGSDLISSICFEYQKNLILTNRLLVADGQEPISNFADGDETSLPTPVSSPTFDELDPANTTVIKAGTRYPTPPSPLTL